MGSLVSSPSLLKDTQDQQGLYFAFPDLSIRTEGQYSLRFSLIKLVSSDFRQDAKSKIITQVFSDPFTVYSAKKVSFAAYENKIVFFNIMLFWTLVSRNDRCVTLYI